MKNIKERFLKLLNLKIDKPDIKTNIDKEKLDEDKIRKIVSEEIIKHKKIEYEKITVEKFLKMFFIILLASLTISIFYVETFSLLLLKDIDKESIKIFSYTISLKNYFFIKSLTLINLIYLSAWEYITTPFRKSKEDEKFFITFAKTIGILFVTLPIMLLVIFYIELL